MSGTLRIPAEWVWNHTIPIYRAYEENGEWVVEGLGGDDEPESIYNTRVTLDCIRDMKKQCQEKEIQLLRSHWDEKGKGIRRAQWWETMGEVRDMLITPSAQFFPKIFLDKSDQYAQKLFNAIRGGKKLGLSFGGGEVVTHTETYRDGRIIKAFDKLDLWHFIPTTAPVYSKNLNSPLSVISRSMDWNSAENRSIEEDEYRDGYPDREKIYAIYREVKEQRQKEDGEDSTVDEEAETIRSVEKEEEVCNDNSKGEDRSMLTKEDLEALGGAFRGALEENSKSLTTAIAASIKDVMREMNPEPAPAAPAPAAPAPAAPAPAAPAPAAPAPAPAPAAPSGDEIARSIKLAVAEAIAGLPGMGVALKGGAPAPAAPASGGENPVMREIREVLTGKKLRKDVTNPEVLRAVDTLSVSALNGQIGTDEAMFRARQ